MVRAFVFALLLVGITPTLPAYAGPIGAAVAYKERPAPAVALDASRKPTEVLTFMKLKRGMHAIDVLTGSGYYAELMARVVGPQGHVTAFALAGPESDNALLNALVAREPNVSITNDLKSALAPSSLDFAMIHLNYHDFYWESAEYHVPRSDPDKILAALFAALKPGGIVALIDHAGPAGDTRVIVTALHRIDPETVKADFARAGFTLEAQSSVLANPADDHSKIVFDPAIRGKTDRFVFRFRKPR